MDSRTPHVPGAPTDLIMRIQRVWWDGVDGRYQTRCVATDASLFTSAAMHYEFIGRFREDDRERMCAVLRRFPMAHGFEMGPRWSVIHHPHSDGRLYLAVSHRGQGTYYGYTIDELIYALREGADVTMVVDS